MAYLGFVPPGVVLPFAGATAPQGWLLCDGTSTAISRTVYKALFDIIGTTYGVGDGSTTFNLPDMRGVFPRGAGTNGTGNYGGVTGHTPAGGSLGAKGGQKTAKNGLALSDPGHGHTPTGSPLSCLNGGTSTAANYNPGANNGQYTTIPTSTTGITLGAGDNETVPASLALNYIIKI